jgi:molybdenum-dependent DNA-binding transcriptional regulator ModE
MVADADELWFNADMLKTKAIELLGGTVSAAAEAIGISYQAVHKWPDVLPDAISDRVVAAIAKRHLPPEMIGQPGSAAAAPAKAAA